ncbi:DUF2812 domain-containing protein [Sutcliffiella cohnii]|uniref:DUF2812 domain-containing protein n=1 Tax=Sutcliffiella cohnii TaxID=33932 RepID=UPI002E22467E|nr:DUF2812 domain-containing protein [Sutcliffiella cohnii]
MSAFFRPMWSFDVQKTEKWLSRQAEKGYHFHHLHRFTRSFSFQKGEPKSLTYRIGYDKFQTSSLSRSLVDDGWEKISQSGKWYVLVNGRNQSDIKTTTSREAIMKRNNYWMYFFSAILLYLACMALLNITIFASAFFSNVPVERVESPYWIITYIGFGVGIVFLIFLIYSVLKIRKSNKELSIENQLVWKSDVQPVKEEMKRRKFGWMYSPDKLENWLEKMESEGYQLYRVNKLGTTFYFLKGEPRLVKYCADYQSLSRNSYFEVHRQAGWQAVFRSTGALQKWTIWSKEYNPGEEQPQMYSDKTHQLKHAKRVASSYTMLFLPLTLMYLFIFSINIGYMFTTDSWSLTEFNSFMFLLLIFVFGSFIGRSWMYYYRLKRA